MKKFLFAVLICLPILAHSADQATEEWQSKYSQCQNYMTLLQTAIDCRKAQYSPRQAVRELSMKRASLGQHPILRKGLPTNDQLQNIMVAAYFGKFRTWDAVPQSMSSSCQQISR